MSPTAAAKSNCAEDSSGVCLCVFVCVCVHACVRVCVCAQVLHKAVVEVDEKGTTAASATSVGITAYSLPATFIVNRPFFFFLYHEATSSLLFMGRVIDPTQS